LSAEEVWQDIVRNPLWCPLWGTRVGRIAVSARNIVIGQKVEGTKVARAKELRREMTPEERTLWQQLRANRLRGLRFRRQQVIDGFIADFYCHAAGLVLELDSSSHDHQADYDAERDRILSARGLRVLRIRNEEIRSQLRGVLQRIAASCGGEAAPDSTPHRATEANSFPCSPSETGTPPRFGEGPGERFP
jgi:very-short-patch-repair endonuclease